MRSRTELMFQVVTDRRTGEVSGYVFDQLGCDCWICCCIALSSARP